MLKAKDLPKTLQQAVDFFSDDLACVKLIASIRWNKGIAVCWRCASDKTSFLAERRVWKCESCKKYFSVKVGTIFEDSPLGLDKWLTAMWLIVNAKNGISTYEIHRSISVTQKTAWLMLRRIRLAAENGSFDKFFGNVEADEMFQ